MPADDLSTSTPEFRTIARFPAYRFGSDGSVWSCWRRGQGQGTGPDWFRLKPRPYGKYGHAAVQIIAPDHRKAIAVHRLVCEAFHGPCPEGMECRHLNGDARDNRPENLRWGTRSENRHDTFLHGRTPAQTGRTAKGELQWNSRLTADDVRKIRALKAQGLSYSRIAPMFGVNKSNVGMICRRCTWQHVA